MEITNFINLNENDMLSSWNISTKKELLMLLKKYYITYRNKIDLPSNVTFGLEIEYDQGNSKKINSFIENKMQGEVSLTDKSLYLKDKWLSKKEKTLEKGGEITSPIMYDTKEHWQELQKLCKYLKQTKTTILNAGGHIHIGANILESDYVKWRKFLKLYTIYEHVLFRFGYGDKSSLRPSASSFANPLARLLYFKINKLNLVQNINMLAEILPIDYKNYAVNFKNICFDNLNKTEGNTLEFRFPNGTNEEVIWQNNINAFTKMLLMSNKLDEEFLDFKINQEEENFLSGIPCKSSNDYQEININDTLEFVDLIFTNNLDKINFLRQYLNNYQNNKPNFLCKTSKFVK